MSSNKKRIKLFKARERLGLSPPAAGKLAKLSDQQIFLFERGGGLTGSSMERLRNLCRAYMKKAEKLGYDPDDYHESKLCPGEFPKPASKPEAEVA